MSLSREYGYVNFYEILFVGSCKPEKLFEVHYFNQSIFARSRLAFLARNKVLI